FPQFRVSPGMTVLFEANAGFLRVEDCIRANIDAAMRCGATIHASHRMNGWEVDGDGVRVSLDHEILRAARLALCCGPWTSHLLQLQLPLEVLRKPVFWFKTNSPQFALDRQCPIYGFETMGGFFYGFPSLDGQTVKVAEHTGRERANPETVNRSADEMD